NNMTKKFAIGDRVEKIKGSSWSGCVVGFYSTSFTPQGYAVESENEPGSVQIYPESALRLKEGVRVVSIDGGPTINLHTETVTIEIDNEDDTPYLKSRREFSKKSYRHELVGPNGEY